MVVGETLRKSLPCEPQKTSYTMLSTALDPSVGEQSRAWYWSYTPLLWVTLCMLCKLFLYGYTIGGSVSDQAPRVPSQSISREAYACKLGWRWSSDRSRGARRGGSLVLVASHSRYVSLHNALDYMDICSLKKMCICETPIL